MLQKAKLIWSKTNRWHRILLLFLIVELKLIPGGQLGFYCNDPALSHPFTGDTISWKWLLATTILLPLAVMLVVERKYHRDEKTVRPQSHALRWYKEYLYGTLINLTAVQTLKLLVGSPRPHFFDSCRPEEARTCEDAEYVSSYICTKAHWLTQSDKSFPSGHTSLAIHAALFIAYYLRRRTRSAVRAAVSVQCACVAAAAYCAVSRVTDHRHHWWDVLAGALIAAPVLIYTIVLLCRNFECTNTSDEAVDPTPLAETDAT